MARLPVTPESVLGTKEHSQTVWLVRLWVRRVAMVYSTCNEYTVLTGRYSVRSLLDPTGQRNHHKNHHKSTPQSLRLRESEAQCPALSQHAVEAGQKRHGKRISKKAQLKNCCLGGLRARQRKKRTETKSQFFLTFRLPSIYLMQLYFSRDNYYPIQILG